MSRFSRNGKDAHRREPSSLWHSLMRLATPGVGVKRWALLGAIGVGMCSVGIAYLLFRQFGFNLPDLLPGNTDVVILAVLFLTLGIAAVLAALYGFHRSVGHLILDSPAISGIVDEVYTRRLLSRGPRIVAIGGGTGLSVLLRGLKAHTDNLTAIVTVGDDGGSSGRLREEFDILPPGDVRNCIVAMSDDESLITRLFQYRFERGEGLEGHSFGNLFITAMTDVAGSFDDALTESSRVLSIHGKVIPATRANLRLSAKVAGGVTVHGESKLSEVASDVERIYIHPADAEAHPMALKALEDAQLIVIGPGSLYTSILPNLLISGIADAIKKSPAVKVYVVNIATEQGETTGYSVRDHHEALKKHTFSSVVKHVMANSRQRDPGPEFFGSAVRHDGRRLKDALLHTEDLVDLSHPIRHDSEKLALAIINVYYNEVNQV